MTLRQNSLFSGLRFLLAGFEEACENQFVEELVAKKGQIAKRYDSSCTHVIVCNLTYNDPICVAARKDGKALVTDVWVADCLDADKLLDVNSVLYRPLKNLDGIRGGENLCVCLTGYQGLARKNIMRMVELMGGRFTKPLVGSVVTHLICYKFEGEKYELAKKTGLVMVNHFWLEDCLKAWTLLPESDYAQSGCDAEASKSREVVVEDSPEDDALPICDKTARRDSLCEQVLSQSPAQILKQKSVIDTDEDKLSKGSKAKPKSGNFTSSPLSPPTCNRNAENKVASDIGHSEDVGENMSRLEHINTVYKPSIARFPVSVAAEVSENGSRGSMLDAQKDESTSLYVEEGNESDHSSGRTSFQEVDKESGKILLGEMKVSEPNYPTAMLCEEMEMTRVVSDRTTKGRISGAKGLTRTPKSSPSGDDEFESSGTKRKRSLQLAKGPPLEKTSGHPVGEENNFRYLYVTEEFARSESAQSQQGFAVQGSGVQQEIPASIAGTPLAANRLPRDMENVKTGDAKTIFDTEKATKKLCTEQTEIDRQLSEVAEDARKAMVSRNATNEGQMDVDGANTKEESPNRGIQKTEQFRDVENQGHMDGGVGADVKQISDKGMQKSVQPTSSPGSTCTDEKEVLKSSVSPNVDHPVSLRHLAQIYNPARRGKGKQTKPVAKDKENLTGNETNQNVKPEAVQKKTVCKNTSAGAGTQARVLEPSKMCFAIGGSTDERDRLHSVVKVMGGKICKCRHQWRDEATHVILPGPLRRTEKFLAGAAAGRWILKPEYLEASKKAGKFLEEEAYEWYGEGTNDKGSISLQAPRKWRMLHAAYGVGAFHCLRVVFYGECISPPLDTLKRAIKAGGGLVLASTPPYTRHLADGVSFALISPGIPREDHYVQEFLRHEIACVTSEYLVDLVCHPSSSLDKYVLYETVAAVKAAKQRMEAAQNGKKCPRILSQSVQHNQRAQPAKKVAKDNVPITEDISCSVCGRLDDEEVMLLCGDDKGGGCGTGIHIHCCTPPLVKVPDEDWFCSNCQV